MPEPAGAIGIVGRKLDQWRRGDRTRMSWLVESDIATAGQPKRRHQAESLVADLLRELDPLRAQLLDCRVNVFAHQVQLVVGFPVGGMGGQLGRRKGEDQPSAPGIDRGEVEHLAKEGSVCFSIAGENDRVNADDHRAAILGCRYSTRAFTSGRGVTLADTMTVFTDADLAIETEGRYGARNYEPLPVVLCHGEGVWVHDVAGRRYFDALSASRPSISATATRSSAGRRRSNWNG